ncbi:Extracellular protein [Penicillium macrosclerotiorum]|uniref:Extracellular protein n=1 Tax=Penicillium macrosclerotiorum TaxID=303699 RepID=UPI002548863C|nr:Extracellular protein [Penicillium macrosclerotiorum]KAJ5690800.1 Extracellular protein [Penicillium macrosclerotiorum]
MKGIALLSSLLAATASAHMQMAKPYPIRSPLNKDSDGKKDYSYTNPLQSSGSDYPCKGYANDPFDSQATYQQGKEYEMELDGSATHDGGSCQLALTYDQGKTFKVIESMLGDCPIAKKYSFTVPSDAPSGEALLAWTWFNKVGNREMYMNCAMVTIGGSDARDSGNATESNSPKVSEHKKLSHEKQMSEDKMEHMNHPPMEHTNKQRDMTGTADSTNLMGQSKMTAFDSLPDLFVANVDQAGKCVTIEGAAVDFPIPGDAVIGKIDGKDKGYKCTGEAPFLPASSDSSDSESTKSTKTSKSSKSSKSSKNNNTTRTVNTNTQSMSMSMSKIASAFGTPTADPRVLSNLGTQATTNNAFSNYVGEWSCVSGEILCSPDGFSWAMCSNSRPIYMGPVAAGMLCRFGAMVTAGW